MAEVVEERKSVVRSSKPWPASWDDRPATGVPRRFGMGALFAIMTLYAVVFAVMQSLGADPTVFVVMAVLLTGVGVGQTLLFDGKFPRAASICLGTVLFPIEMIAAMVYHYLAATSSDFNIDPVGIIGSAIICIPTGALFGYLAGGLAGGVFVLLDLAAKRTQSDEENEDGEDDKDDEENQEP